MDKNILGKFKDELQGFDNVSIPILEVVAPGSKTYNARTDTSKSCILKNKSVPGKATIVTPTSEGVEAVQEEAVEKSSLCHQHFLDGLTGRAGPPIEYNTLRSKGHEVRMQHVVSISASSYDDKRWVRDDGVRTYAHGHWRISADQHI